MVKITTVRNNGEIFCFDPLFKDPISAMRSLAEFEFGFGGRVIDLGETFLKVETRVLGAVDTVTIEGSADEMREILFLASFYTEAVVKHSKVISNKAFEMLNKLPKEERGKPFYITALAPMFLGKNALQVALMLACGIVDDEDFEAGLHASKDDLVAALQLKKDGDCGSLREALAL